MSQWVEVRHLHLVEGVLLKCSVRTPVSIGHLAGGTAVAA